MPFNYMTNMIAFRHIKINYNRYVQLTYILDGMINNHYVTI